MKPLVWMGNSLEELATFPRDVCRGIGYALHFAQAGDKHPCAKPLEGFGGAGVLGVVEAGIASRKISAMLLEFGELLLGLLEAPSVEVR